ncbi:hypothetical protein NOVO_07405 [Rickettsiales bacterium Ac37b]|nr:hypothetical protein NOVO_07405 [Rickettsiales bacterium Ac37b]
MMHKLFDGYLKNYKHLFKISEEFARTKVYFTAHVNGTEENHANLISDLIYCTCQDMDDLKEIENSYKKFEEITIMFWNGIYKQIQTINS